MYVLYMVSFQRTNQSSSVHVAVASYQPLLATLEIKMSWRSCYWGKFCTVFASKKQSHKKVIMYRSGTEKLKSGHLPVEGTRVQNWQQFLVLATWSFWHGFLLCCSSHIHEQLKYIKHFLSLQIKVLEECKNF